MTKNLTEKIVLMLWGAGLVFVASYGPKYDIDGSKVKDGWTKLNAIVEYKKEGDKVRYVLPFSNKEELNNVVINGEKYTSKDTLIYEEALKRYNYLTGKIDSIKTVRKESELQRKLDEEQKKTEEVLEILRR